MRDSRRDVTDVGTMVLTKIAMVATMVVVIEDAPKARALEVGKEGGTLPMTTRKLPNETSGTDNLRTARVNCPRTI